MTPLKAARKRAGQTLEVVASAVGTDTGNLSRIERGDQTPSASLAEKLAKHFGSPLTSAQVTCPALFADEASVTDAAIAN